MPEPDTSPTDPDPTHSDEVVTARDPQKEEIVWLPPETDEEWVLFHSLLDDIKKMYAKEVAAGGFVRCGRQSKGKLDWFKVRWEAAVSSLKRQEEPVDELTTWEKDKRTHKRSYQIGSGKGFVIYTSGAIVFVYTPDTNLPAKN